MRFIARKESNGAMFHDTLHDTISKLSPLCYTLLQQISQAPIERILAHFSPEERELVLESIETMKVLGMLDEYGKLNTLLIAPAPSPECLSAPLRVYLNVTSRCNLRCRHCVNNSGPGKTSELSPAIAGSLIEEMTKLGVFELVIGGGEVFLYPALVDVIREANLRQISVGMTTNGHLVDKDLCTRLSDLRFRYLSVSIDGATAMTHDYIRGSGAFDAAIRGLKNLIHDTPHRISLHFVVMKHNIADIPEIFKMAEELGCDIGIDFAKPSGRILNFPLLLLTRDEYLSSLDMILTRMSQESPVRVIVPTRCHPSTVSSRHYDNFGCGAANVNCGIDSDGNVSPCSFLPRSGNIDNLREKSLRQIWLENEEFKKLRALQLNETCASCAYLPNCRGGCRANVLPPAPQNSPDPLCLKGITFDRVPIWNSDSPFRASFDACPRYHSFPS